MKNKIVIIIAVILVFTHCTTQKTQNEIEYAIFILHYNKVPININPEMISEFEDAINNMKPKNKGSKKIPYLGQIVVKYINGNVVKYDLSGRLIRHGSDLFLFDSDILKKYWGLDEEALLSIPSSPRPVIQIESIK